jgi:plasmid stabilization system protein ParE
MSEEYRIVYSAQALADLVEAHAFVALDSREHAAELAGRIVGAIDALVTFPYRNALEVRHMKTGAPFHKAIIDPYIIFYRIQEKTRSVHIVAIRHGARRRPRHLR